MSRSTKPISSSSRFAHRLANDNGHELAQAPPEARWRTLELVVSGVYVAAGRNEIVITWPQEGERSGETRLTCEWGHKLLP